MIVDIIGINSAMGLLNKENILGGISIYLNCPGKQHTAHQ
jgi:hypothetical protein